LREDQHKAAARLGVSRSRYQEMEKEPAPIAKVKLAPYEWCRVMRWRVGKTQQEVADDLSMSKSWVNYMENGKQPCDTLLWYWEA
jgi:DNA-binding XRE family transcriptional regulator